MIKLFSNTKLLEHDEVTNSTIKNEPIQYGTRLENFINAILRFRNFLSSCKQAVIVPIKRPGEEPPQTKSYRPEREQTEHIFMTRHQQFYADTPAQFGIRTKHSTAHKLLRMVEFFNKGLVTRKWLVPCSLMSRWHLTQFDILYLFTKS